MLRRRLSKGGQRAYEICRIQEIDLFTEEEASCSSHGIRRASPNAPNQKRRNGTANSITL
jgi:hypothetical protein